MTRNEFIDRMDEALQEINGGYSSCSSINNYVSEFASKRYNQEFRFSNNSPWWLHDYLGLPWLGKKTVNQIQDLGHLRQCLWQQFLDMSLEQKLYLDY